jgi:polysaccharide chain length determinant protein (PEP-CTERM system associated)
MIRNGELRMSEVKRVGRKYWWVLVLTVLGGVLIALGLTAVLPKRYLSETIVLVEQPTVSSDIVKPVVTEAMIQRLTSMQQEILSRSRLEPIIQKFGLYPKQRNTTHMEDLVLLLQSAISVTPLDPMPGTGSRQQQALPGFTVGVTFDDPQTAQRICSEITTMFMEQNAKYMDDKSNSTTQFVSQQLVEAKRRLDDQEAKLAEFKQHYIGSLPEQEQTNLSLLTGMNSQLEALSQALSRAQQDKAFNESLLSTQLANWNLASQGNGNPETLEHQLAGLQDLLSVLQSRYTPEHPDVIKTKSQIEEIKKQMAEPPDPNSNPGTARGSKIEPPQIQQLRARMRQDDLNLEELTKRQAQLQNHINVLQGRLQTSPVVEQQYKEVTRNHQTALDFYNDLMKKQDQSSMAQDLNHQQEGEHFTVLDPPTLPVTPSFPKKLNFAGGGFGAGLALGLGILYLLAALDKAMHNEQDVEVCLKLPVLAAVPTLDRLGRGHGRGARLDTSLELARTRT